MNPATVWVRTVGAVTPAGTGVPALLAALADPDWQPVVGLERPDGPTLPVATCRGFSTQGILPPLAARRLDRPSRLLAVAAREALAALGAPLPWPGERVGVTAGTWNAGTSALVEVLRAVFQASPEEAPPAQFPSTVANAPASQLGILDSLAGPNLTFAEKQVGALRAVAEAARLLRHRRADAVLACGVDEGDWLNAEGYARLGALRTPERPGMVLGEGAAVMALALSPGPRPLAAVAGWGSAAAGAPPYRYPADPGSLAAACNQALRRAGLGAHEVDLLVSLANGLPALAELEARAMESLFGRHRPAAVGVTERLGEGAAGGALRVLAATAAVAGDVLPSWGVPAHLAAAGFPALVTRPRRALVGGLAGGGSAVALVIAEG